MQKRRGQGGDAGEAAAQASDLGLGLRGLGSAAHPVCVLRALWRTEKQSSSWGWVGLDSIRQALTQCAMPGARQRHPLPTPMLNVATGP